jgi:hypothetical protein
MRDVLKIDGGGWFWNAVIDDRRGKSSRMRKWIGAGREAASSPGHQSG